MANRRLFKGALLVCVEAKRLHKQLERLALRSLICSALERANTVYAHRCAFRERFLREALGKAVLSQQLPKTRTIHR